MAQVSTQVVIAAGIAGNPEAMEGKIRLYKPNFSDIKLTLV